MQIKGFCVSKSEPSFLGPIIATKLTICYCFAIRQRKDRKKPAKWQIDLLKFRPGCENNNANTKNIAIFLSGTFAIVRFCLF